MSIMSTASIQSKRNKALLAITGAVLANGCGAAIPTPGVETCKHLAYSGVEITLCITIYNIYFDTKLSKSEIKDFLVDNGIVTASGTGLAYIGTKAGHSAISELLNFVPVVGWGVKGILAGSITSAIGIACMQACHELATR